MNHRLLLAACLALGVTAAQAATAPTAKPAAKVAAKPSTAPKGVKCGDSYIAAGQVCHKAPPPPAAKKPSGKKCGAGYIAANAVCHK